MSICIASKTIPFRQVNGFILNQSLLQSSRHSGVSDILLILYDSSLQNLIELMSTYYKVGYYKSSTDYKF